MEEKISPKEFILWLVDYLDALSDINIDAHISKVVKKIQTKLDIIDDEQIESSEKKEGETIQNIVDEIRKIIPPEKSRQFDNIVLMYGCPTPNDFNTPFNTIDTINNDKRKE